MYFLPCFICLSHCLSLRVTSGLVVLAKSKEAASSISKEIRDKSTKKTYLARVKGKFPLNLNKFQIVSIDEILNVTIEDDGADDNEDENKNEKRNTTDRGNNLDKKSQNKMNDRQAKEQHIIREQQQQLGKKRDRNGAQKQVEINESDLPPRVRDVPTVEEVVSSDRVRCSIDAASGDVTLRCPIGTIHSCLSDDSNHVKRLPLSVLHYKLPYADSLSLYLLVSFFASLSIYQSMLQCVCVSLSLSDTISFYPSK